MSGFTKLFSSITSSSIWNEDDKTRIVWITMLALCEPDGVVRASVGGLAHTARVTREDCEKALQVLESPDPDSRSPENEGRRIQRVNGGFLLLNYGKYREARSEDERRAYMREYMQSYRKKSVNSSKQSVSPVSRGKPSLAKEEGEEEGEGEADNPTTGAGKVFNATPEMLRLNSLFRRRDTTRWNDKERKALRAISPIPEDEFSAIERYYRGKHPPNADYRRRDLLTLLNNWGSEVDRARGFKEASIF